MRGYLYASFFYTSQELHNIIWPRFAVLLLIFIGARAWKIAVMGHIVQHATSLCPYSFRMATVVEVSFRVFTPIALKARPILMTPSLGTATNGPKDPRAADGHPAGIRDLQGAWLFSNKNP